MDKRIVFLPEGKRDTVFLPGTALCVGQAAGNAGYGAFGQFDDLPDGIVRGLPGKRISLFTY